MHPKDWAAIQTLKLIWRASPLLTVAACVVVPLSGLIPVAFMVVTGTVVDAVPSTIRLGLGSSAGARLLTSLGLLGGIYVLQVGFANLQSALAASLGSRFTLVLRGTVLDATMRPAGIAHLEDPKVADDLAVVSSEDQRWFAETTVQNLVQVASGKLTGLGAAFLLASFRWWAPLLLFASLLLAYRWLHREIETFYSSRLAETPGLRRAAYLRDLAVRPDAAKELRVFGMSSWLVDRFASTWVSAMQPIWRDRRGHAGPLLHRTVGELIASLVVFAVMARAAYFGDLGIGALVMFAQATQRMGNLGPIGDPGTYFLRGVGIVRRLVRLSERLRIPSADLRGEGVIERTGTLRFDNVSFAYPGTDRRVIDGLTLEIPPGRALAIVGLNGAGKTTLMKLLARLYDPDGGRITVDGVDLRDLRAEAWRQRIGVIFQDFVRYELQARANVGFGAIALRDETALDRAAAKAGASTLIDSLPARWETILSRGYEGGVDLSGGEWQKIALARAFIALEGGADVLVLDEPTASLDVRAEAELFDRFLEITRGVTTILISHRFSTVRHADRIAVIEGARVVEQGTHSELLRADSHYARLYKLQAARFASEAELVMGSNGYA